jgi:hypothetical protein
MRYLNFAEAKSAPVKVNRWADRIFWPILAASAVTIALTLFH